MLTDDTIESWSRKVAILAVDELVNAGLVRRDDFESAVAIAAEEIQVRLAMEDYPPIENATPT